MATKQLKAANGGVVTAEQEEPAVHHHDVPLQWHAHGNRTRDEEVKHQHGGQRGGRS